MPVSQWRTALQPSAIGDNAPMQTDASGSALWLGGLLPEGDPESQGNARESDPRRHCQWDPLEVAVHKAPRCTVHKRSDE